MEALKMEVRGGSSQLRKPRFFSIDISHFHGSPLKIVPSTSEYATLPQHVLGLEVEEFRKQATASGGSLPIRHRASTATGRRKE
jgi:hypothetical protein